ncbi:hypothetical protein QN386_23425 [Pseudomonas sp. CCI3.2]|uniref:hypothetical protein n=1 Tax=unclassified Pseudomonas TaxID=196821 RepID=UPI002AC90008|nr:MULTISPECIES: hypothetical protein [unclassified Pseudomonas]MEB0080209.1 hypothetical protein [Pseudomonas sp. MH10out]MEB0092050.1 hypothetical protein [Pseudomonas sp. CCI4.2]MEB0104256.1 hypothetical protein [Pseudomonas sp. CCI3.2]MEB0123612.1 hypothetical protein [Pseudomonas sp. CCI1.2]MEB0133345.1 hypothetical protein [Pseudomonas sp. CCI2.4]
MKAKRTSNWSVFAHPIWMGLLMAAGLFAALLGNGAWDMLSWVGMGIPAVLSVRGLFSRYGKVRSR